MPVLFQTAEQPASIVMEQIRSGIPAASFRALAKRLDISQNELADKLRVATRTLSRLHGEQKLLPSDITEKVLRVSQIMNQAHSILADEESVVAWLNTEAPALGGAKPIDLLDTYVGAKEVEGLITGLAYGNFQ